jgi:hypothetical protein
MGQYIWIERQQRQRQESGGWSEQLPSPRVDSDCEH